MTVLVTGANGHVGFVLTKHLVERGYKVRASVRDAGDPARTARLQALGVEIVEADLLKPDTLARAAEGMEAVFQVAATYEMIPKKGAASVIRDSVEGGINMLRAAKAAGVKRVVFTSSCVAIGPGPRGAPPRDERQWNEQLAVPYFRAKTEAERRAWAYAKESGLDLVAILPGAVSGPGFARNTPTIDVVENIRKGMFRMGVIRADLPFVDVRDVAEAHRLALETPSASGRYVAMSDAAVDFRQLAEAVRAIDPKTPKVGPTMPDFMLGLMPAFDRIGHLLMGTARTITPEMVGTMKGRSWNISNARAKQELGWSPRISLQQSLKDTLEALGANRRAAA
ncbi:MAG: NAD-dependent epimerase/dehydratase family protein [Alphaproteobacteria bacterium]